jgi:hypothetical protein
MAFSKIVGLEVTPVTPWSIKACSSPEAMKERRM